MPYIGNNTPQTAVDTVDQRFDEFKETSIDASKVQTIFLGGDESGVADSPTDAFGVSLNVITTDCNHKTFRRIDMGSVEQHAVGTQPPSDLKLYYRKTRMNALGSANYEELDQGGLLPAEKQVDISGIVNGNAVVFEVDVSDTDFLNPGVHTVWAYLRAGHRYSPSVVGSTFCSFIVRKSSDDGDVHYWTCYVLYLHEKNDFYKASICHPFYELQCN